MQGMERYRVGTAVRDELLGLPAPDPEWVVIGAGPEDLAAAGYLPDPHGDGGFIEPQTGVRCRPACAEAPGPDGGLVAVHGAQVTLEQELARRDLTIHAMAIARDGRLIDPYGGRADLDAGLLRHVTPRFAQHPEYLFSVAATAARLARWGFHLAHATYALMRRMAAAGIDAEPAVIAAAFDAALAAPRPSAFFRTLGRCGVFAHLCPALDRRLAHRAAHAGGGPSGLLTALDGPSTPDARCAALVRELGDDAAEVLAAFSREPPP